jgi:hypothetical protein
MYSLVLEWPTLNPVTFRNIRLIVALDLVLFHLRGCTLGVNVWHPPAPEYTSETMNRKISSHQMVHLSSFSSFYQYSSPSLSVANVLCDTPY